jgi:hypothetical protein
LDGERSLLEATLERIERSIPPKSVWVCTTEALAPAVRRPRGLARLQAILDNWLKLLRREIEQGCLMISGSIEYDDRPGAMRDAVVGIIRGWSAELQRAIDDAKATGELRADTDAAQLAFEIYGLMLGFHQNARLLRAADSTRRARAGLQRLIEDARSAPAARPASAAPGRTRSVSGRAARPAGGRARTSS